MRESPGPCPVCGAAHAACTATKPGSIEVVQTPARDARLAAERVQETLPPDSFTTGTYRRKPKAGA